MERHVVDAELRRFVVRFVDPSNTESWGSGVFIAPGWVLTCAHVVGDDVAVRLRPDPRAGPDGSPPPTETLDGIVRARSVRRDGSTLARLWPFPDLALVEIPEWTDHVCAPLSTGEPDPRTSPHAWGYGQREEGVLPPGAPASYQFVGETGDGFLELQAGEAPPGVSGAPLVCPTRGAVVGVMSTTRSPNTPRGGWASPISALTTLTALDDPAKALGSQLLAANARASWRSREAWARVVPVVDGNEIVDRPWVGTRIDPRTSEPSTMLRAEFRVVKFDPRGSELDSLRAWCSGPEPTSVRYVDAAGGTGKTRLGIEACCQLEGTGWVAGFLPHTDRGIADVDAPRLLVVDYVEEHDAGRLTELIGTLTRSATAMTPVRLLLLSRPPAGSPVGLALQRLREDATGVTLNVLDAASDMSAAMAVLTSEQRERLFTSAVAGFGATWHGAGWRATVPGVGTASAEAPARPLDVLFGAFDHVLISGASAEGERSAPTRAPVDRVLDHEIHHWKRRHPDLPMAALTRVVALATLCAPADDAQAAELLDLIPGADTQLRVRLDAAARQLYEGRFRWNPLRPDRLGEALIRRVLVGEADGGLAMLGALLRLENIDHVVRALNVLVRLVDEPGYAHVLPSVIFTNLDNIIERAAVDDLGFDRKARLELFDAAVRATSVALESADVASISATYGIPMSQSLDSLGSYARDYGRSRDARVILSVAVAIDEHFAASDPDNDDYLARVGTAHQRLGRLEETAGRLSLAREHYDTTLAAAQRLADRYPQSAGYLRDLGVAHLDVGDLDQASRRVADAREHYTAFLHIAERLRRTDADEPRHQHDFGLAHLRLGSLDRVADDTRSARAHYLEYLRVAGDITSRLPNRLAFQQDLGIAHQYLGDLDHAAGEFENAHAHFVAALEAAQSLAALDPDRPTYREDITLARLRLGDLDRDAGRSDAARQHFTAALDAADRSTNLDPDNPSYRQDVALVRLRLGDLDRDAGRSDAARQHFTAALDAADRSTNLDPDNPSYRQDVALARLRLGDLDRAAGRSDAARRHFTAALDAADRSTNLDPDNPSYRQDVALARLRLGDLDLAHPRLADLDHEPDP